MLIVLLTEWRIKHRCITLENIKFVNYEKIKTITGIALMAIFGFTSCQSEVDDVQGENPNTNAANSTTANNLKRTSMYDGSFDDFIDGASCSSIASYR
jgi:hypothetical protein